MGCTLNDNVIRQLHIASRELVDRPKAATRVESGKEVPLPSKKGKVRGYVVPNKIV